MAVVKENLIQTHHRETVKAKRKPYQQPEEKKSQSLQRQNSQTSSRKYQLWQYRPHVLKGLEEGVPTVARWEQPN